MSLEHSPVRQRRQSRSRKPIPPFEPVLVTIQAAARMIGNSQWTVRDKIKRGILDAKKDGKRVLVTMQSIRAHVENMPTAIIGQGPPVQAAIDGRKRRRAKQAEAVAG
jgi:hypothetical protein